MTRDAVESSDLDPTLVDVAYHRALVQAWHHAFAVRDLPGARKRFERALEEYAVALAAYVPWPIDQRPGRLPLPPTAEHTLQRSLIASTAEVVISRLGLLDGALTVVYKRHMDAAALMITAETVASLTQDELNEQTDVEGIA